MRADLGVESDLGEASARADSQPASNDNEAQASPPPDRLASFIGLRLREMRGESGASTAMLAASLGVESTALERIESGQQRATAGQLHNLSAVLGVPLSAFYADPASLPLAPLRAVQPGAERLITTILEAFGQLTDGETKRRVVDLLQALEG